MTDNLLYNAFSVEDINFIPVENNLLTSICIMHYDKSQQN